MMVMLQRYWVQLTSDRKRFGLLCAVLAAGLLLWARLIITSKVPRTAVAEPSAAAVAPDELAAESAGGNRSDNRVREVVAITILEDAARDPFLINPDFFPKPTPDASTEEEVDKSDAEPVENPEQEKARRRAQLMAHVERLRLEAAMTGQGMAVISGTLYRLNDMIPSNDNPNLHFELIEVRARSVVLRHDDATFELAMDAPGTGSP